MPNDALTTRIDEVSDGTIGVLTALLNARATLGDRYVVTFLNTVPEKGSVLWERFRAFQKAKKESGVTIEMNFNHFIASVIAPNPFGCGKVAGGQEVSKASMGDLIVQWGLPNKEHPETREGITFYAEVGGSHRNPVVYIRFFVESLGKNVRPYGQTYYDPKDGLWRSNFIYEDGSTIGGNTNLPSTHEREDAIRMLIEALKQHSSEIAPTNNPV